MLDLWLIIGQIFASERGVSLTLTLSLGVIPRQYRSPQVIYCSRTTFFGLHFTCRQYRCNHFYVMRPESQARSHPPPEKPPQKNSGSTFGCFGRLQSLFTYLHFKLPGLASLAAGAGMISISRTVAVSDRRTRRGLSMCGYSSTTARH